jgi:hypothetical protein
VGAGRTWEVLTPAGALPLRFFRQVLYLRFASGGMAEQVLVDADETHFEATFQPYSYDACGTLPAGLTADLDDQQGAVAVTLDAPRHVESVSLAGDTVLGAEHALAFYRLDGQAFAGEPTVVAPLSTGWGHAGEVLALEGWEWAGELPGPAAAPRAAPAGPGWESGHEGIVTESYLARQAVIREDTDFVDVRFGLRLQGPGSPGLHASDVTSLRLRSYPTGPRIGIADPADLDSATFFWQAPGEVGKSIPAEQGSVDAGPALAEALSRYLGAFLTEPAPEYIDVALVIASDAPCVLDIAQCDVVYHLAQHSFPGGEAKQVLRFTRERLEPQALPVQLPANAVITFAEIEMAISPRGGRLLLPGDGEDLSEAALVQHMGARIDAGRWVAQRIATPEATSVSGLALGLMPTAAGTELSVEVQEEWQDQPSGRKLVEGTIELARVGRRAWAVLELAEAIVVGAQPHWLLVKATRGHAVWLAEAGGGPIRILDRTSGGNWVERSTLDGYQALYRFFSQRAADPQEGAAVTIRIGDSALSPMPSPAGQGAASARDTQRFDLKPALNAYLDAHPAVGAPIAVTLSFSAGFLGFVTVYPPQIEYDLE